MTPQKLTNEMTPSSYDPFEYTNQRKKAMDKLSSVQGLSEEDQEMLASNQVERDQMAVEIKDMRTRSVRHR